MKIDLSGWQSRGCPPIVASISGGKDSAAMALALKEADVPFVCVFLDTGWEWSGTYDYLRGPLTSAIGPIKEISGPNKMKELCRKKGMFPSRLKRYCTQDLKVFPMASYLLGMDPEPVNTVGVRSEESAARSRQPEWERQDGFDCDVWRPILRWTEQDVIDIHQRHGLAPNPLYLAGASRVGCWTCIYARKAEIRMIAELNPGRIDEIRELERVVGEVARKKREANGKPMDGWTPPTWFQSRLDDRRTVNGVRESGKGLFPCWPIDRVVQWAKGPEGQLELFEADPWDRGCARWGMCDLRRMRMPDDLV